MADTKNHVRESILKEDGSKDIYYKQNTAQDVLLHDGTDEDIRGHIVFYANCATAADVAAKEISLNDGTTDVLRGQAYVSVTFENGNTAEAITLSINGGTAYNVDGATSTSIAAGNTVILIFDGSKFIVASGAGATKIKNVNITEGSTRYVGLVEGETDNGQVEYDDSIKMTAEGLEAKVGKSTVDFTPDAEQLNTDTRETNRLTSGLSLKDIVRKVWNIIAGLGSLAFRSSVGTAQLDTTLAEDYNLTVHKSGTINGAAVNDLYNGTDFSGDIGTKALDATVGATLQNSITTLNSKVQSFENTKSDLVSSALGKALGMTSTYTWAQVVSKIKGVANKGSYSKTFTPSTSKQTASSGAGYYSSISLTCNAVSLSGNATAAQVLTGKTFYNTTLSKVTGTIPIINKQATYGSAPTNGVYTTSDVIYSSGNGDGTGVYLYMKMPKHTAYYQNVQWIKSNIWNVWQIMFGNGFIYTHDVIVRSSDWTYAFTLDDSSGTKSKYHVALTPKSGYHYFLGARVRRQDTQNGGNGYWRVNLFGDCQSGRDQSLPWINLRRTYGDNWNYADTIYIPVEDANTVMNCEWAYLWMGPK